MISSLIAMEGDWLNGMEHFMYMINLPRERDEALSHELDELIDAMIADDGERPEQLMCSGTPFSQECVLAALHASKALQSVNLFATGPP